jgi:tripartite-type tricarboxylate transporter receptor subunit TctC
MKKLLIVLMLLFSAAVSARELVIVWPDAAGGGQDVTLRKIQTLLAPILGYPVVVEYHPGAEGAVARQTLINANQPGRTYVMMQTLALMVASPPDIVPVSYVGGQSAFMAVRPDFDVGIMDCRNPKPIFFGTAGGVNSASNMLIKMLPSNCRDKFIHVPYRGGGPGLVDLMAGNIDIFIGSYMLSSGFVQAGKLKIAAELGISQSGLYQNVPMFKPKVYRNMPNPNSWYVFAYKNTNAQEVAQAFETLYASPEFQEYQRSIGAVRKITADSAQEQFQQDMTKLKEMLEKQAIKTTN